MKKLTAFLLALLMLVGMMTVPVLAAEDIKVYLFGEKLEFDVPAQIVNGRTLVPMRKIFESLGYTVDWDKSSKTAIAVSADRTIRITIDSYTMYVNEETKALDVPACIIDGRTMVPARAISEASGYKVDWDKNTKSVLITKIADEEALNKKILTTIGDYEISEAVYNCFYYTVYSTYAQYEAYLGENWINEEIEYGMTVGEIIEADTKSTIEFLVTIASLAKQRYGITFADVKDVTNMAVGEMKDIYEGEEAYKSLLSSINTTESAIETYFGLYAILGLAIEKTGKDGKLVSVTDAETEKLFKQQYAGKMKVQHILVATESIDGYSPSRTDAEAQAIVNNILKELRNGTDFGLLISFYNEDPGQTPDGYYVFGEGEMVPEFEAASKKLAAGKYTTQAVKTDYGYHIIKRYPLDRTSEEFAEYKVYLVQEKLQELVNQEIAKGNIKWNN